MQAARDHFESGMRQVLEAMADAQHVSIPTTIFYAFKQSEADEGGVASTGWEIFLQGLLDVGFAVTSTWPMRTEMVNALKKGSRPATWCMGDTASASLLSF